MTLLGDADYIKEVTQCLSQSMVEILQIKPHDPIEYLAQSLRNYRRHHPTDLAKGRKCLLSSDQVISSSQPDKGNEFSGDACNDTNSPIESPAAMKTQNVEVVNMRHMIKPGELEEGDDFLQVSGEFNHMSIVHKSCQRIMLGIGDLFDEDDFG